MHCLLKNGGRLSVLLLLCASLAHSAPLPTAKAEEVLAAEPRTPVPVRVKEVLLVRGAPAVLVTDAPEDRYLLIFVDYFMASAIRQGMGEAPLERPLTHDLMGILLGRAGATLRQITLTEQRGSTYYALISLEVNGQRWEVDARPSDALALAVRLGTPVLANPSLLRPYSESRQPEPPEVVPDEAPPRGGA